MSDPKPSAGAPKANADGNQDGAEAASRAGSEGSSSASSSKLASLRAELGFSHAGYKKAKETRQRPKKPRPEGGRTKRAGSSLSSSGKGRPSDDGSDAASGEPERPTARGSSSRGPPGVTASIANRFQASVGSGKGTPEERLSAKLEADASASGRKPGGPRPGSAVSEVSTPHDRMQEKLAQENSNRNVGAQAVGPSTPSSDERIKAKMAREGSGQKSGGPRPGTASQVSTPHDRVQEKLAKENANKKVGSQAGGGPGASTSSLDYVDDRIQRKILREGSGQQQGGARPGSISQVSTPHDRMQEKLAKENSRSVTQPGAASLKRQVSSASTSSLDYVDDRIQRKILREGSGQQQGGPRPGSVSEVSTPHDRMQEKIAQENSRSATQPGAESLKRQVSSPEERLSAKLEADASGRQLNSAGPGAVSEVSTPHDRVQEKLAQENSRSATQPGAESLKRQVSSPEERLSAKLEADASGRQLDSAGPGAVSQVSTPHDRVQEKLAQERSDRSIGSSLDAVATAVAAATDASAVVPPPGTASQVSTPHERMAAKLAKVDSSPDVGIQEKMSEGEVQSAQALGDGAQGYVAQGASSDNAGNGLIPADDGISSEDPFYAPSPIKSMDGDDEDKNRQDFNSRPDAADGPNIAAAGALPLQGTGDSGDGNDAVVTAAINEFEETAPAAHYDPYTDEVVVDEDKAFGAELAPEEELGPIVDASGVMTMRQVEEEEKKISWRDPRVRKYAAGFVAAVAIMGLAIGLGVGLTRTTAPPQQITILEEVDICNYTNSRASWLMGTEINDDVDEFNVYFLDGTFAPVSRAFGFTVSLSYDGNRVAVGGRFGDAFHVYERNSESNITKAAWPQLGSNISLGDYFDLTNTKEMENPTSSVSLSGDGNVVACGFPYYRADENNDTKYEKWGAVAVYKHESGVWEQLGDIFIGEGDRDYIGQAMSLSEDGAILALGESNFNRKTGRVRVFQYTSGNWDQVGDDIPGESRGDNFGVSVSLSRDGSMIATGALNVNNGEGSARVFRNFDGVWVQMGDTLYPEEGYTFYGWPVSLSGDGSRLAVSSASYGSDGDVSDGGKDKGYVRVYENADGTWSQLGEGMEGVEGGDGFGWSLSLSADGTTLAAGASNSDRFGTDQGYAKVYRYHCGNWTQIGEEIEGMNVNGWTGTGIGISETGEHLAIGTPFDYAGEIASPGYVRVYQSPFNVTYINSLLDAEESES